ncbi:AMP dependent coa ligase [Nesidiocoris tenuis]|uniref:AMP dependent coa ligase n=1 Tax=Nesidiocoris tenuis TaxID=355587 RepID=A0ABN7AA33_9HEMI|nr:AMP dependent coa ligase [Nesidiocoris tenuis]
MLSRVLRRCLQQPKRALSSGSALHEHLATNLKKHGNSTALLCPFTSRKLTYSRLDTLSGCFASWLNNHTPSGCTVATALPNSFEMTVSAVGAVRAGVPLAPLNPHNTSDEIARFLQEVRPRWIITYSSKVMDILEGMRLAKLKDPEGDRNEETGLIVVDNEVIYQGVRYFDECLYETDSFERREGEGGLVVATGTGTPQRITDSNILANCLQLMELDRIERKQRIAALLPMLHVYGLTHYLYRGLSSGAELVVIPNWAHNLDTTLGALKKSKVTLMSTVRAAVETLLAHDAQAFTDLETIIIRGGPNAESGTLENRFSGEVVYNYGVTEGPIIFRKSKIDGASSSVGKLLPETEAKVVANDEKTELPPGVTGEIFVKGPQLGDGKRWHNSGEMGYYDEDGNFFVTREGTIAIQGLRVRPEEIESSIKNAGGVKEVAVFRVEDRLAAAVVPSDPYEPPSSKMLVDLISSNFAPHKHIHSVVFMSSLPKTAFGEVDRRNLSRNYCPAAHERLAAVMF